ncbi:protein BEAN1 isoform X2 [Brachyhypopomus gauderio]|uniref:protein BEAN1 isoform X2 n=1 Tax=Brachyhypopomus gauderio TaxID=698409 RepID=UPI004041244C
MGILSYLQPALLLHVCLVLTISNTSEISTFSKANEDITPACHTEGFESAPCPFNWLRCPNRKHCGREYVLMKLICSVSSNQSNPVHEYPDCRDGGSEASLLVSPLVVAGIVIGLVLFLSCVTIIVGSLRKDSRLRHPHLRSTYAPDGFSYGGSVGELTSSCMEEFPPTFPFDPYIETLSQVNAMYPDSPPHYDECVGPGATQIYIPTDDPPPYSLTDPCHRDQLHSTHACLDAQDLPAGASWLSASGSSHYPIRLQDWNTHPVASISMSATPLGEAPPYEAVVGEQNQPLPLIATDLLKHTAEESVLQHPRPHPHPHPGPHTHSHTHPGPHTIL